MFDTKTLYLGASLEEFNRIREILEREKIAYKKNIVDHNDSFLAPGRGTVRSLGGNFGKDKKLYEIMVAEKDYENAAYLVRK